MLVPVLIDQYFWRVIDDLIVSRLGRGQVRCGGLVRIIFSFECFYGDCCEHEEHVVQLPVRRHVENGVLLEAMEEIST